jgi:hypothetical protein
MRGEFRNSLKEFRACRSKQVDLLDLVPMPKQFRVLG